MISTIFIKQCELIKKVNKKKCKEIIDDGCLVFVSLNERFLTIMKSENDPFKT